MGKPTGNIWKVLASGFVALAVAVGAAIWRKKKAEDVESSSEDDKS